ncbi:unnamed protein product [Periconia digitata]|uniref:Secreted protein n=1 Tax=Periconia digitata TaxID=1303443 RepID=A0A9W4USF2_9PLEO|nr:unnamed protein product [Periconia digitata]
MDCETSILHTPFSFLLLLPFLPANYPVLAYSQQDNQNSNCATPSYPTPSSSSETDTQVRHRFHTHLSIYPLVPVRTTGESPILKHANLLRACVRACVRCQFEKGGTQ